MSILIQRSLAGGEISPSLWARVDTTKYATGLKTLRNFFIMRHGGVANRPGTSFVAEVKDSTKVGRFIPFVFNSDQTYLLEFGHLYMRVHRNRSQILESDKTITAITNANPAVVSSTAHGFSNGDEVYVTSITGAIGTYINNRNFKVANSTANTFSLTYMDGSAVDSTSFGSYTSSGTAGRVYTIATPYVEADLSEIQFVQSGDIITLVHPSYAPRELSRIGHTNWTLNTISFAPGISPPGGVSNDASATGTQITFWVVTSVNDTTGEESLASLVTSAAAAPTPSLPFEVYWTAATNATSYNVYKRNYGLYGYIGTTSSTTFLDTGISPDLSDAPPTARDPFSGANNYPSVVGYIQQRQAFANTNNDPTKVWLSRSAQFKNFTVSTPLQDDDAVTFSLVGRQVNEIRHLLDLSKFVLLTSAGEWTGEGDASGIIRPGDINPKQQAYNGASSLSPIVVGGTALYLQARGSVVRDLAFEFQQDGYRGNDLTIFSAHLFDGHSIVDWAYQQIPHSVVWAVREDGVLLGLTYVREHQIYGWHRHDFDGFVENVCTIPEEGEDAVYLLIRRTINGQTKRYIERMNTRQISDIKDSILMDSTLSFDGRNPGTSHTMTLSGGSTWAYSESLTLTSSTAYFSASDIGNQIQLTGSNGTLIRFTILGYTSSTVVTGKAHRTIPVAMRSVAMSDWARAVDHLTGLWHLEGKTVSVFADGFVAASAKNESYQLLTVTNGSLSLDKPYSVIHVGLPITADIELLDIDTAQSETMANKKKLVTKVTLFVESSRGIFVGGSAPSDDEADPLEGLYEAKTRNAENYNEPTNLQTGTIDINLMSEWNSNGRVFIRQIDPLPLSVLAIAPDGLFPFSGAGGQG
jgi:hypothetical protein